MAADILAVLVRANLIAVAAVLMILALRPAVTRRFGAQIAYGFWWLAPLTVVAGLLPARRVVVEVAPAFAAEPLAGALNLQPPVVEAGIGFDQAPWLVLVWVLGVGVSLAVLAWRQDRFVRSLGLLRREAGVYRAQAAGIGPAVVGALRPRIVVPSDFEARFNAEERVVVLAHEQVHFHRGDPLVNALVAIVRCVCWFNPLVHIAAFHLRLDQELACDAAVIARFPTARRRYAEAMLKTQLAPMAAPLACYWPARSVHPMKRRIAMLKDASPHGLRRLAGALLVASLSLGAGFTAWAAQPVRIETVVTVARADVAEIADPIVAGSDLNRYTPGEGTPLVRAARRGDLAMVERLLNLGADVNRAAPGDGNPLIAAAASGRLDVATLLVARGADVNGFVLGDETPLINAARGGELAMARLLVDRGADVNLVVPSGNRPGETRSPLGVTRDVAVADYLRSRGARP